MSNVSAIIVTRGDVAIQPIIDSLPAEWEILEWDNEGIDGDTGPGLYRNRPNRGEVEFVCEVSNLSVYGRYAAIEYASHDLIYVQDDDVIVSDPQAIVDAWEEESSAQVPNPAFRYREHLVANMPQEFRHGGYEDSCLVGFGACFHRDLPDRAFVRFFADKKWPFELKRDGLFDRTCDVVFTTLTPRVLVDVPKIDREFASDDNRMWRQPTHYGERTRMLDLSRQVRDS